MVQRRPNLTPLDGPHKKPGDEHGRLRLNSTSPCGLRKNDKSELVPNGTVCDEFPVATTNEGGQFAVANPGIAPTGASLKLVPGRQDPLYPLQGESSPQGGDTSGFSNTCGIADDQEFIVIPMPDVRPIYNLFLPGPDVEQGEPLPLAIATINRSNYFCGSDE